MTQYGKRHAPASAAFAIDSSSELVDAGEGSDLMLQVFVGERDHVATVKVLWAGLVYWCMVESWLFTVKAFIARPRFAGLTDSLPSRRR